MRGAFEAESDISGRYSFKALYAAYCACRRRKRNTANAMQFEMRLLDNLYSLSAALTNGAYKPTRSVCFVVNKPKRREIFAADFSDRVVHHLIVPRLEEVFEPRFIFDSYACRKAKGTHGAAARLRGFMNSITKGNRVSAWMLQLDVRSFFMSIDKNILGEILARKVRDRADLDLALKILFHDCTKDYVYKGAPGLLATVPPHKSLFHVPPGKGLPIGNLTSQFFANVYLNELDQFVKHVLKVRYYIRYVDDFILLGRTREELQDAKDSIECFLRDKLRLTLKPEHSLKRVSEGADFLGYIVRPDYVLARNRVTGNLKQKLEFYEKELVSTGVVAQKLLFHEETVSSLRSTLSSYLGHLKHANTRNLVEALWKRYGYLQYLFTLFGKYRLNSLIEPAAPPKKFRTQYSWFIRRYRDYCIFFQKGRFCEFYGRQAEKYSAIMGLKRRWDIGGMGFKAGFPVLSLDKYKGKAVVAGIPYVVVLENGYYKSGIKRRVVTEIVQFKKEEN